jgi:hypothetical protein
MCTTAGAAQCVRMQWLNPKQLAPLVFKSHCRCAWPRGEACWYIFCKLFGILLHTSQARWYTLMRVTNNRDASLPAVARLLLFMFSTGVVRSAWSDW